MTVTSGLDMQGRVTDWASAYAQGYRFAVPRCVGENGVVDPDWGPNVDGARAAGMLAGAYHFIAAGTSAAHCKVFKNAIAPKLATGPLLIWLDIEKPSYHPNPTLADVKAWFDEWRKDYPTAPVIAYAPHWYVTGYMGNPNLAQFTPYLWASLYVTTGTKIDFENSPVWATGYGGWKEAVGWQYHGSTDIGVGASVDLDVFHGDMAALRALAIKGDNVNINVTAFTVDSVPTQRGVTGTNVTLWLPDGTTQTVANLDSAASGTATIDSDHAPKGGGWLLLSAKPYAGWYVAAASVTLADPPPNPLQAQVDALTATNEQQAAQITTLQGQVTTAAATEKERIAVKSGANEAARIRAL